MADTGPSRTGLLGLALLLVCGFLAGCGTDVAWLLTEQGRLTPKADWLTTEAETLGTGIEQPVYDAEDNELEACRFLNEAVAERLQQKDDPTIGEQMVSDLSAWSCSWSRSNAWSAAPTRSALIGIPLPNSSES